MESTWVSGMEVTICNASEPHPDPISRTRWPGRIRAFFVMCCNLINWAVWSGSASGSEQGVEVDGGVEMGVEVVRGVLLEEELDGDALECASWTVTLVREKFVDRRRVES